MMGFGGGRKGKAEFKLAQEGPVLILVDDFEELLDSPRTRSVLADQLARQLKENKAAGEIVPSAKLDELRRKEENFDSRGAREVGEMAGARQVVWLNVRDCYLPTEVEEVVGAARLSVMVKVINAEEKKNRNKVRLWPTEPDGRLVSVEIDANKFLKAETPEARGILLAAKLSEKVARLFYDYAMGDFE